MKYTKNLNLIILWGCLVIPTVKSNTSNILRSEMIEIQQVKKDSVPSEKELPDKSILSLFFAEGDKTGFIKKVMLNDEEAPLDKIETVTSSQIKEISIKFEGDSIILFLYTK